MRNILWGLASWVELYDVTKLDQKVWTASDSDLKMATWCETLCGCIFVFLTLTQVSTVYSSDTNKDHVRHSGHNEGIVHFNNPKLLPDEVDQGYVFDTSQEKPDSKKFGGIDLEEEAENLALKLLVISNTEIGVTRMQVICITVNIILNSLPCSPI